MADSFFDIAQMLRDHNPALNLVTKGTGYDRLYTEQRTVSRGPTYLLYPTITLPDIRPECVPGVAHPDCAYLILVDAYKLGGDDHKENWTFLYRLDLLAFSAADPAIGTFPDMLVNDGYQKVDEYGDNSSTITWTFDVINPAAYTKPAPGTAHPGEASAVFVSETKVRNGPVATITRRYEKLATLTDYEFDEETNALVTITRQIVPTSVPTQVAGQDVSQRALGTSYSLRTIRGITTPPASYTYNDYIDYEFPNLLLDIQYYAIENTFVTEPYERAAFSKKIAARILVEFSTTKPTLSTLYQIKPVNVHRNGIKLNVNANAVLTDAGTLWVSWTNDGITTYFEYLNFDASEPSLSTYLGQIGSEKLIAQRIVPWGFNLWKSQKTYITLE